MSPFSPCNNMWHNQNAKSKQNENRIVYCVGCASYYVAFTLHKLYSGK